MIRNRLVICLVIALSIFLETARAKDNDVLVYMGTYTGFKYVHHSRTYGVGESHSKGIYVSRFNATTGETQRSAAGS